MEGSEKLERALFEARPYVEYWDRLKETVRDIWRKAKDETEFLSLLQREMRRVDEPFKTDLKIFLQKFEGLG